MSATFHTFNKKVSAVREELLKFLMKCRENKKVAAYGAAAKGNTLF